MLAEIEAFVNWLRRRNPQARTWRDYGYDLRQFAASTGDRAPESVTFHDVDHFVTQQAARGYKPGTINRRLAVDHLAQSAAGATTHGCRRGAKCAVAATLPYAVPVSSAANPTSA